MNEELLKKISELIEKIDCLAGNTLDVKRQEWAHCFEPNFLIDHYKKTTR